MSLPPPFVLKSNKPTVTEDGSRIMFIHPIKDMDSAVAFFKEKMLVGDQIPRARDGIYSWLLKEGGLAIIPVESEQEIGSVHANLWSWTPTLGQVRAAGELEKHGSSIIYNLQSGSFMRDLIRKRSDQTVLMRRADSAFRALDLEPTFLRCRPEGIVDCDEPVEELSGKRIIENAQIITKNIDIFWYRQFFTEKKDYDPVTPRTLLNTLGPQVAGRKTRRKRNRNRRQKLKSAGRK